MNIEINIETLLFGNVTYTDQTISKNFEKVLFLLNKDFVLPVSSFSVVIFCFSDFSPYLH